MSCSFAIARNAEGMLSEIVMLQFLKYALDKHQYTVIYYSGQYEERSFESGLTLRAIESRTCP